jgi:hypothetical protein
MVSAAYEAGSAIEVTMAGPGSGRRLDYQPNGQEPDYRGYGIHA